MEVLQSSVKEYFPSRDTATVSHANLPAICGIMSLSDDGTSIALGGAMVAEQLSESPMANPDNRLLYVNQVASYLNSKLGTSLSGDFAGRKVRGTKVSFFALAAGCLAETPF